jgi:hypothetical protein
MNPEEQTALHVPAGISSRLRPCKCRRSGGVVVNEDRRMRSKSYRAVDSHSLLHSRGRLSRVCRAIELDGDDNMTHRQVRITVGKSTYNALHGCRPSGSRAPPRARAPIIEGCCRQSGKRIVDTCRSGCIWPVSTGLAQTRSEQTRSGHSRGIGTRGPSR